MAFNLNEFFIPQGPESEVNYQLEEDIMQMINEEMNQNKAVPTVQVDQDYILCDSDFTTLNAADVALLAPPAYETIIGSPASPCPSDSSTSSYENLNSLLSMPAQSPTSSDEIITEVVSTSDVFGQQKRKRGRKPKSDNLPRAKRTKVYEIDSPFQDKEQERKRLNAINAKRHRDMQKAEKEDMQQELTVVKSERDNLLRQVEELQKREAQLKQQMSAFKAKVFSLWSDVEKGAYSQ